MLGISNYMTKIQALITCNILITWWSTAQNYGIREIIYGLFSHFFRFVNQDPEKQSGVLKFIQQNNVEISLELRPLIYLSPNQSISINTIAYAYNCVTYVNSNNYVLSGFGSGNFFFL